MTSSILESEYVEPNRPYSQNELKYNRERLYRNFRLGKNKAHHQRCDHFYLVRVNGRKEREMIETDCSDVGNCSVCWKISKTPSSSLKNRAMDRVHNYGRCFEDDPETLSYRTLDLEETFYKWLYEDQQQYRRSGPRNSSSPSNSEREDDDLV
jgi:hypothetical protein